MASTEAEDGESGGSGEKGQFDLPHLLGIIKMDGNLPAQRRAAEKISQAVSISFYGSCSLISEKQKMGLFEATFNPKPADPIFVRKSILFETIPIDSFSVPVPGVTSKKC